MMIRRSRFSFRHLVPVLGTVGLLAVALPADAAYPLPGAPKNQYGRFDTEDEEVQDAFTGLKWDRRRVSKLTAASADAYCLFTVFPSEGGRVPTVKELQSIVDEFPHQAYENQKLVPKAIDQGAFPDPSTPTDAPYATSTIAPDGRVWTVDFSTGATALVAAATPLNVRCVH